MASLLLADRLRTTNVTNNAEWLRDVEVPDVLGWRDMYRQPEAALEALARRERATGTTVGLAHDFKYPKGGSGERIFPIWDPLTELGFRASVVSLVEPLSRNLPRSALSRRAERLAATGWRAEPWRPVRAMRRDWLAEQETKHPWGGRGTADVRNCFPSISTRHLTDRTLPAAGCDDWAIAPLRGFLRDVGQLPGHHTGLPVGQEASSILGTIYLSPIDRALADFDAVRWVDDLIIAADSEAEFQDAVGIASETAQRIGLTFNEAKEQWMPWGEALDADESLAFLLDETDVGDPVAWLVNSASTGETTGVGRCLARLAAVSDTSGAEILRHAPWLTVRVPRQAARHYKSLWSSLTPHQRDWASAMASGTESVPDGTALRYHLLHSLRKEIGTAVAADGLLSEGDEILSTRESRPLAYELLAAAVKCGDKRIWNEAIGLV